MTKKIVIDHAINFGRKKTYIFSRDEDPKLFSFDPYPAQLKKKIGSGSGSGSDLDSK